MMSSTSECAAACGVVEVVDKSMTELTYDSGNFLIGDLPEHSTNFVVASHRHTIFII
jgi:hypothetical protein